MQNRIEGNWHEIKGKIKSQWGKLTDDEIEKLQGDTEQLAGAIQKRYGKSRDEARKEVESWQRRLSA